jgi:predicted DNA-binding transcriptional regulator AlpA
MRDSKLSQSILSKEEASDVLGVSVATMATWRRKGTGPRFVLLGLRNIAYLEKSITEWVEGRVVGSSKEARKISC